MKLLVIGANGQLGWELCRRGRWKGYDITGVDLPDFDITNEKQIAEKINKEAPQLVVNASAYTAVDKAESEAKTAFSVNHKGPQNLARVCTENGISMVHISTDYVFNGKKTTPYHETDAVDPTGVYGKSKAAGEEAVREALAEHIIIRTAWLYGVHGNNFVKTMMRLGKENETIAVVDDQHGCPTYAEDLAFAILVIAQKILNKTGGWGTYHYCGGGRTTWYGFAKEIFEISKSDTSLVVQKVDPISTKDFPTPAKRPANSVLDCRKIEQTFGIDRQYWKRSLERMLVKWLNSDKAKLT